MADDDWFEATKDRAIDAMRQDWIKQIRILANLNEEWARNIVAHGDEACGTSMEFVAHRLRKMADREEQGQA